MCMIDILDLSVAELKDWLVGMGHKPFRAKQIFKWLHQKRVTSFEDMSDLPKGLREKLAQKAAIHSPQVELKQLSRDGTRKYRLRTHDGHSVEAVYIPDASGPGKNALCISSQVGCAMGCTFCATAAMKLQRNLSAGEIVGQYYQVSEDLVADGITGPERPKGLPLRPITNIVYMGMGEPLHNYENVKKSIEFFLSTEGQELSSRRITVSTSGLVTPLKKLGEETDVHVAISLNSSDDKTRDDVMPVNRKWDLETLMQACRDFPLDKRRRITFEYVLLAGVNDSDDDARRVVKLLSGLQAKVNLIPFNAHPLSNFEKPSNNRVHAFQRILTSAGLSVFIRKTRGDDIDAACGMLGGEQLEAARKGMGIEDYLVQIGR